MLIGIAGINYSDTKTFIEYFGEKWLQQWRERLGKHASWISAQGGKEEGGARVGFCLSLPAQAKSQQ
jgi:hypothetical protein